MKSFADWTTDLAQKPKCDGNHGGQPCADPECWNRELPVGLYYIGKGEYKANCVVCGEFKPVHCDPSEFDASYFYCGGSPRCCP